MIDALRRIGRGRHHLSCRGPISSSIDRVSVADAFCMPPHEISDKVVWTICRMEMGEAVRTLMER